MVVVLYLLAPTSLSSPSVGGASGVTKELMVMQVEPVPWATHRVEVTSTVDTTVDSIALSLSTSPEIGANFGKALVEGTRSIETLEIGITSDEVAASSLIALLEEGGGKLNTVVGATVEGDDAICVDMFIGRSSISMVGELFGVKGSKSVGRNSKRLYVKLW